MKPIALIIEDEIPAAERLCRLLESRGFEVAARLPSVSKSIAWLSGNATPDWLFVDIELRDGNVFEILEKLRPESRIVFTTAYANHALDAFAHGGLDYLLKPIDEEKLDRAIEKAGRLNRLAGMGKAQRSRSFLVASGGGLRNIDLADVQQFFSENNVTYLCAFGQVFPIGKSLDKLEGELDAGRFFRISRRCVLSRKAIKTVKGREVELYESGEKESVSRQRLRDFLKWLEG